MPDQTRHSLHHHPFAKGKQGSEWDRVMIIDERAMKATGRRRWLYTAITRARKSVIIAPRLPFMTPY